MKKILLVLLSVSFLLSACTTAQEKREQQQRADAQKDASSQSMQEMDKQISK